MSKVGLRVAQALAVVFAIGVSAWMVMSQHRGANPEPSAAPGAVELTPAEQDDVFLQGSKSFVPSPAGEAPENPVFLPSSKSLPMEDLGGAEEPPPEAYLPTSKSALPPRLIEERKRKREAEAKEAKAKEQAAKQASQGDR
ncbi:MAG: hypothetical protein O2894_05645 [Planctomycetota bacterium]|nr:hypothetical protein [Planctomycetota bacterium]